MPELPLWYMDFLGAVVARLPRDIDEATAKQWVDAPEALGEALSGALLTASAGSTGGGSININGPFAYDKAQEGLEMLEDVTEPAQISMDAIEQVPVFNDDEFIVGDEVVERVQAIESKLGQRHAEYLLANPHLLPEEYRRYALVFPGTVWRDQASNHYVPCLSFSQGEWKMVFGILETGMDSSDRLMRPRA